MISADEFNIYGCPKCGYQSGYFPIQQGPFHEWRCGECAQGTTICSSLETLEKGEWQGDKKWGGVEIKYTEHPRKGTPKHGRPDIHPEFFYTRGIGMDYTPGCFVCGGEEGMYPNVSAFVQCKAAGERVVKYFETGARLDYRESEPDRVQVKIGSCEKHKGALKEICNLDECIWEKKVHDIIRKAKNDDAHQEDNKAGTQESSTQEGH